MTSYIALLRKDDDSDYGVDFPDFPGCVTAGRTLDEARRSASEALELHVEGLVKDGVVIPVATTLDAVMGEAENRDAVAFLVDVATAPARSVRINVMLPADLVDAIGRATTNRSRFLADAAWEKLKSEV